MEGVIITLVVNNIPVVEIGVNAFYTVTKDWLSKKAYATIQWFYLPCLIRFLGVLENSI